MCRPTGKYSSHRASMGLVCLALLTAPAPYISGQELSVEADKAPVSAPERDYRFEVASIRPSDGPTSYKPGHVPGPAYTPGRYREENVSMAGLA